MLNKFVSTKYYMIISYVELIGYVAAFLNNISIYPQAYNVYIMNKEEEYEKIEAISIKTFSLVQIGCMLWVYYSYVTSVWPMFVGTTVYLIPNSFVLIIITNHYINPRPNVINTIHNVNEYTSDLIYDSAEVISASGSNIND